MKSGQHAKVHRGQRADQATFYGHNRICMGNVQGFGSIRDGGMRPTASDESVISSAFYVTRKAEKHGLATRASNAACKVMDNGRQVQGIQI